MRIAFMGTPEFAVAPLRALHAAGHDIVTVYAQPPRPAGRGKQVRPSPVQMAAEALGIPVRTPARLRTNTEEHAFFADLHLDAAVVAAYGLLLPAPMLNAPRRGCLNIHASLLPRWRGAAPIQAAILAGDTESGITIMRMDEGLDTGPMLLAERTPITAQTTASTLHDALAEIGARLIVRALAEDPPGVPQPAQGVTHVAKFSKADAHLDFTHDAAALERRIRALTPWPGTFCLYQNETLRILAADIVPATGVPGTVLDDRLTIACGSGALRPTLVQRAGRAAMPAEALLRGFSIPPGSVLT